MEMDYLKDEKKRILENLRFDVKGNKDVGIDIIIREIIDRYDTKIKDRSVTFGSSIALFKNNNNQ